MLPETRRTLTISAMRAATHEDKANWAVYALETLADSENLCILASLSLEKLPDPQQVDRYFRKSFDDLGLTRPEYEEYLRQFARDVAEEIVSGEREPAEGCGEMSGLAADLLYPDDMIVWMSLDDDWDAVKMGHLSKKALEDEIRCEARAFVEATPKRFF